MNISKKKQKEFDKLFSLVNKNNFVIDVNLLRELFNSDYYEHFIQYAEDKIKNILLNEKNFNIHIDINSFGLSDLYHYDKILQFAKLLHIFTDNLLNIFIYESSYLFVKLVSLLNNSLNVDINKKIIFETKKTF